MDIEHKLKEWGFEKLVQKFTEDGINLEVLKLCKFEDISSLLSPLNLGSKIIFKKKLQEFQKGVAWVEIYSEVPIDCENAITIPSCSREHSSHTASISEEIGETPTAIKNTPTASVSQVTHNYSPKGLVNYKLGIPELPKKRVWKSKLCHVVLHKNLKENVFGQHIISFYERTGYLDTSNRNKLAKLVVSFELNDDLDKSITCQRFFQLREAIVKIFPTEAKETWYRPFQKLGNGKTTHPKGKLFESYQNNRRKLIKLGIIKKRPGRRSSHLFSDETVDESSNEVAVCKLEPEDLEWDDDVKVLAANIKTPTAFSTPPPSTSSSTSTPASRREFNPMIKELDSGKRSKTKDEFDMFGEYIASVLRKCTDLHDMAVAKHRINQILFDMERSNLNKQGFQNLPSRSGNSRTRENISTELSNSNNCYSTEDDNTSFD